MRVKVEGAERLDDYLDDVSKKLERDIAAAVNDAAFKARAGTPEYLKGELDRPTPFTLRPPVVKKASSNGEGGASAFVHLLPAQNEYLATLEFGGVETNINTPSGRGSRDQYGNLRKRFTRPSLSSLLEEETSVSRIPRGFKFGKKNDSISRKEAVKKYGTRQIKRYFIGTPMRGIVPTGPAGLWARVSGNKKLQLVFEFDRIRSYGPTLDLRNYWQAVAAAELDKRLDELDLPR